jgi:hypothetical protein
LSEYLKATAEDPKPEVFLEALGDVARATYEILRSKELNRKISP